MRDPAPRGEHIFGILPQHAQVLLVQCSDFLLKLSDALDVEQVVHPPDFDPTFIKPWRGKAFQTLVAKDSEMKIDRLLSDNSAIHGSEGRWRHLNLIIDGEPDLPLLMKYFEFNDDGEALRLICARDLRPLLGMQQRFHREVDAIGRQMAKLEMQLKQTQ